MVVAGSFHLRSLDSIILECFWIRKLDLIKAYFLFSFRAPLNFPGPSRRALGWSIPVTVTDPKWAASISLNLVGLGLTYLLGISY